MARTHFSGPVTTGTVREGSTANYGYAVLSQTVEITLADTNKTLGILPRGSQLADVLVDVYEVWDSTTATLKVGVTGAAARYLGSGSTIDLNAGGRAAKKFNAAQASAAAAFGSDTTIVVAISNSSAPTTGAGRVTLVYVQREQD